MTDIQNAAIVAVMTSCNDDDDGHTHPLQHPPHPTTKIAQSVQQDQIDHAELNGGG